MTLTDGVELKKGKKFLVWWSDDSPNEIQIPTIGEIIIKLSEAIINSPYQRGKDGN